MSQPDGVSVIQPVKWVRPNLSESAQLVLEADQTTLLSLTRRFRMV